jgi:SAM-dependent methyltransferase
MSDSKREKQDLENPILNPPVWSNIYYRKIQLRNGIENVVQRYLTGRKKQTLVDYGCGTKPYEPIFSPYVSEYLGLDIEDSEHVDHVLSEDGTSSLPDNTADVVLSSQVLEHVPNPELYLNEVHRILKKDGLLILSTHGHMIYYPVPKDYWRWTHEGLRKTLAGANLAVKEMKGIIGVTAAGGGNLFLMGFDPCFQRDFMLPSTSVCKGSFAFWTTISSIRTGIGMLLSFS